MESVSNAFSRRDTLLLFLGALVLRIAALPPGVPVRPSETGSLAIAFPAVRSAAVASRALASDPGTSDLTISLLNGVRPLIGSESPPAGGAGLWVARLPFVLAGALGAALLGAAGGRFGGRATGWVAGSLLALGPFAIRQGSLVGPASLLVLGASGSLLLLLELSRSVRPRDALGAGAFAGLGAAGSGGAIGLLLAAPVAVRSPRWAWALPAAVIVFALGAPGALVALLTPGAPGLAANPAASAASPLLSGLARLRDVAGILPLGVAAIGVVASWRRGGRDDRIVLTATAAVFVLTLLRSGIDPERLAVVLPGILLLAASALSGGVPVGELLRAPSPRNVVLALVLVGSVVGTGRVVAGRWASPPEEKAYEWIARHVPPTTPVLLEPVTGRSPAESPDRASRIIEIPPAGSAPEETAIFFDPNLAQSFEWIVLPDPPAKTDLEPDRVLVPRRFQAWVSAHWDAVRRFDSTGPETRGYTIFRRPSDFSFDRASILPLAERLGSPELDAVREESPAFTEWLVRAGTALRSHGQLAAAKSFFQLVTKRDAQRFDGHYQLGLAQLLLEEDAGAKKSLLTALDLEPFHGGVHYNLGTLFEKEGDLAGAETEYLAALQYLDDPSPAHARLGVLLASRGDLVGARAQLGALRQLDPDGDAARFLESILGQSASP